MLSYPSSDGPYSVKLVQWPEGLSEGWHGGFTVFSLIWFINMTWVPWKIKGRMERHGEFKKQYLRLVFVLFGVGITLFVLFWMMEYRLGF